MNFCVYGYQILTLTLTPKLYQPILEKPQYIEKLILFPVYNVIYNK